MLVSMFEEFTEGRNFDEKKEEILQESCYYLSKTLVNKNEHQYVSVCYCFGNKGECRIVDKQLIVLLPRGMLNR